jgi:DNA-binding beta-propeller fold protein YncE
VAKVPSHLAYKADTKMVYVADTGNKRVLSLDAKTGTEAGRVRAKEKMAVSVEMDGAVLKDVVPASFGLQEPSGIVLDGETLYVSDHATSKIYAFSLDGKELRKLDTGLPAGSLSGLSIGPDGKMYLVDMLDSRVLRIDPK